MISDAKRAELDAIAALRSGQMRAEPEIQIIRPQMERHFEHEILRRLDRIEEQIEKLLHPSLSTSIIFTEITMNPTAAGQTQVYTGTLSPAGSVLAPDAVATVTSNDPAVSPTLDSTQLIVSVTYPSGWVPSSTPLAFAYATTSASTGQALSATITPPAPPVTLATGVSFQETT